MNIWFTGLIFETQILLVKVFPKNLHKKRLPTQNSNLLVVLQIFSFGLLQNPKENWSIFEVDLKSSCRGMRDHTVCHLPKCFKLQNENVPQKTLQKTFRGNFNEKRKRGKNKGFRETKSLLAPSVATTTKNCKSQSWSHFGLAPTRI